MYIPSIGSTSMPYVVTFTINIQYTPNVSIFTIHGSCGIDIILILTYPVSRAGHSGCTQCSRSTASKAHGQCLACATAEEKEGSGDQGDVRALSFLCSILDLPSISNMPQPPTVLPKETVRFVFPARTLQPLQRRSPLTQSL